MDMYDLRTRAPVESERARMEQEGEKGVFEEKERYGSVHSCSCKSVPGIYYCTHAKSLLYLP